MKGTIFLAGGGTEKQSYGIDEILLKDAKKILYIPLAWKNEDFESSYNWFISMVKQHKKEPNVVILVDLNKSSKLENYNAVYIGGGNTFKLLKKIKDSGFDKKLVNFYMNGGTIYGGSAGALIFGKDISTALICSDADANEVNLKDTSGMNVLSDYDIQCHFVDSQIEEHKKYVKQNKRNVIAIPEESALLIKNNEYKVIGSKPITIITNVSTKQFKPNEVVKLK